MDTLSKIQQAIGALSTSQRSQLAVWMYELRDVHMGEMRVAETALAYEEPLRYMAVDEYLTFELKSDVRHEYVAGEIFAMSGVSLQHNRIVRRLLDAFSHQLRGGPCQAYFSDVKVRLQLNAKEHFYYPDLMVVCDRDRRADETDGSHFVRGPKLIVEVLSPSTESIDRREKSLAYRQIATLEEYVLVAQEECEVTICRREQEWRPMVLNATEEIADFRSIKLSLPLTDIYRDSAAMP